MFFYRCLFLKYHLIVVIKVLIERLFSTNQKKIWKLAEMDADHVAAWSKGGATDAKNCQMLCKTHNRAKGNR
ncbi:MAG: HNH endonuclease [Chitinophagales bacterium]|nr:HNH endonuclease [Chitinophagales bacterium]